MTAPSSSTAADRVIRTIAPGDGMVHGNEEYYFQVGANAIKGIHSALKTAGIKPTSLHTILDYACGYGRVLRWLKAEFPQAQLLGVDADPSAAAAAGATLDVQTHKLDISLNTPFATAFDLIWVGSLFTHLPADESQRVLSFLSRSLAPGGLLVFTTHGALVEQRIRTRERLYNLTNASANALLQELDETGYGFANYPRQTGYGISVAKPWHVARMCDRAGLIVSQFQDKGWVAHQDVFAARPV